ncbi:MAG: S41 family peptidase [Anaerolineae bacterium]|nr:S41 family peptidase [Anaerolineae bacterium]
MEQEHTMGPRSHAYSQVLLKLVVRLVAAMVIVVVGFAAGVGTMWFAGAEVRAAVASIAPQRAAQETAVSREERAQILWDIWDILEREYIDPRAIEDDEMIHGAASGMVSSLGDPHTAFVEPVFAAIMDEDMQGSIEGIGATVDMVDGQLLIVKPLPNSPALEAGLQPGDVILEVDGVKIEGLAVLEAISLIRGPEGTIVRLLVEREGVSEPFLVPIERRKVEIVTVEVEVTEDNIVHVRLREFNAIAHKRLREALTEALKQDPEGLVLDLRSNPGGYLEMAVEVASEFLPKGTLILQEQERGEATQEYRVRRTGLALNVPLVVLVDAGSASASEIVAGALRDNERGMLIGQRTFGKGSVQNTHELADGSSLRVTIARWLLPSGAHLDGAGIEPDIVVEYTAEDSAAGRDPQLARAIEYLREGE